MIDLLRRMAGARQPTETRAISYQDVWGAGRDWREAAGAVDAVGALALPPFLSCVDLVSGRIAAMPLQAFRVGAADVRERAVDPALLTSPSVRLQADEWVQQAVTSMLVFGEAIGVEVETASNGWPSKVEWVDPRRVEVRAESRDRYLVDGREVDRSLIVHVRHGLTLPGELRGRSVLSLMPDSIRAGLSALVYERDWFTSGAHPSGIVGIDVDQVTDVQAASIKRRFKDSAKGGDVVVLSRLGKYTAVQSSPSDAGLDSTRSRIATEVAAAFHVPPEMVGGTTGSSTTYTTVEGNQRALEVAALMPVYTRLERGLSMLMPYPEFCRFNADAVIRTDVKTRVDVGAARVRAGLASPDEIRRLDDLPPIADGAGSSYLWPPYRAFPLDSDASTPVESN